MQTYKELLTLRKRYPVLKNGALQFIDHAALPKDVLAYTRTQDDRTITVYLNFSEKDKILNADFDEQEKILFSKRAQIEGTNIELNPFGLLIVLN